MKKQDKKKVPFWKNIFETEHPIKYVSMMPMQTPSKPEYIVMRNLTRGAEDISASGMSVLEIEQLEILKRHIERYILSLKQD